MAKMISKKKLSKKAQKELNRQRRVLWDFSPVTRTVDSKNCITAKETLVTAMMTVRTFLFLMPDYWASKTMDTVADTISFAACTTVPASSSASSQSIPFARTLPTWLE